MKNKTATEGWTILISELDSAIDRYVPRKNKGNGLRRNICQKRLPERSWWARKKPPRGAHR